MTEVHRKKSFFDKFTPKSSFFVGFGGGVVGLFIIGFFILLAMFLVGGISKENDKVADSPSVPTQPEGRELVSPGGQIAEVSDTDHIRGDKDSPVTIVEYSDFQCPFCSSFHSTIQRVVEEYDGKVRWVYRHFPLNSIHAEAQGAAEASECADDLGGNDAFWAFGDSLFENQQRLGRDLYLEVAKKTGLDASDFADCIDSNKYSQKVLDQLNDGLSAGVNGTPGNFINGQPLPGAVPYEQIKQVIDSLL